MLWAMTDAPVADVYEFAVLGVLGQHADIDGRYAYPSKATIAHHAKIDAKSAQRALDRLEERRLIGLGDQTAAEYIRADRRPVVYDLLIPLSWLLRPEHAERVRKFWKSKQRPPLTKEERPDIAAAPTKAKRSDAGKPRVERGDSQSPRTTSHGGTTSPARGDSQSATGGLQDPQTSPTTSTEESLSPRLPRQTVQSPPVGTEREINDEEQMVLDAYAKALGRKPTAGVIEKLRKQTAALLADGQPAWWIADRARELPNFGTDLAKHCEMSSVPVAVVRPADEQKVCDRGHSKFNPMIRDPDSGDLVNCPDCHPAEIARHRRQGAA